MPAWKCPMRRRTWQKPDEVRRPRFSVSAICHICVAQHSPSQRSSGAISDCLYGWVARIRTSPRTCGGNLVLSKNFTATSPVTTPICSVSAWRKSSPNTRFSSGVRLSGVSAWATSTVSGRLQGNDWEGSGRRQAARARDTHSAPYFAMDPSWCFARLPDAQHAMVAGAGRAVRPRQGQGERPAGAVKLVGEDVWVGAQAKVERAGRGGRERRAWMKQQQAVLW